MNKVILSGRLIEDSKLYSSKKGSLLVIKIAVRKEISKEKREELIKQGKYINDIFTVLVFGKYAESIEEYLTKDQHILVEGTLSNYKNTQDNNVYYNSTIISRRVEFLSEKRVEKPDYISNDMIDDELFDFTKEDFGIEDIYF